jgi:putative ABC transport system permease protein
MNIARQILALTAVGLRNIPYRKGNSAVIVIGSVCVVAVLLSVLAMATGFERAIQADARPDRVLVITNGMDTEGSSSLSRENVDAIQAAPGIKRDSAGKAIVSAEVVLVAPVIRRNGSDAYITLRGTGEQLMHVRPELRLVTGRMFRPGLHELIIGQAAQQQFRGLELGKVIRLHDGDWTVVGTFAAGDSVRESEAIADATTVMTAYQLSAYNSTTALLTSGSSFAMLGEALGRDPSLKVTVMREPDYLAMVSGSVQRLLKYVAYLIGGIMGIGALFGALNTMYSAMASRQNEIATLRALGFSPVAIVSAIVLEAVLLSLVGAFVGIVMAYAAFNGQAINTLGGSLWDTQIVYTLSVSPPLVLLAIALAGSIGILGGLFPAIRSIRSTIVDALRSS